MPVGLQVDAILLTEKDGFEKTHTVLVQIQSELIRWRKYLSYYQLALIFMKRKTNRRIMNEI